MTSKYKGILVAGLATAFVIGLVPQRVVASELLYISIGDVTRAPIGWVDFCAEHTFECKVAPTAPRDVVLTNKTWTDLVRINKWVNENVKPMTDMDHWGVVEKWSYPDDGYGDCEDYALLKRRMLTEAGWPREARRRPCRADGEDRQGRVHPGQPGDQDPALVGDELPLCEAAIAVRPQSLGRARRPAPDSRDRIVALRLKNRRGFAALNRGIGSRPGHVPTPPRPQTGFARGRPSPKGGRNFFGGDFHSGIGLPGGRACLMP